MLITHLSLTHFRNFGRLELDLPAGCTVIYGANAQGKTNLLEAVYYLATTRSPHTNQDERLLNWDALQTDPALTVGRLVAHLRTAEGLRHLELRLIRDQAGFRREALVDRRKVRLMDLLGELRVVLFLPQDVELVGGPPAARRRYLDITLCQSDRAYCRTLSQYNQVLEQRNAVLRQLAEQPSARRADVLGVLDEQLAPLGARLAVRRARFLTELARDVQAIHYEQLTAGAESLRLDYLPRFGEEAADDEGAAPPAAEWLATHASDPAAVARELRRLWEQNRARDVARGATGIGPHRDDWRFQVNGRSLRLFGSRGQQRSAVLALKLGEIRRMTAETGEAPLLLLDDVLAELDPQRRLLLLAALDQAPQALITTADPAIFPADFLERAHPMLVVNGRIRPQPLDR